MKTKHIAGASIGLIALASQAGAGIVGYEKYTYDTAGNIVEKQIDGQVTRYGYEGNTLRTNDQGTTYAQDEAGRLLGASREGCDERKLSYQYGDKCTRVKRGAAQVEFFYNAEGQLVGKDSNGQPEAFAWDGLGLVLRGGSTFTNESHLVGGVAALVNGDVTITDFLGSTLFKDKKNIDATAFGQGYEGGFFSGRPFIEELDSFIFKYRNYRVNELRWSTADPAGYPDGKNNQEYVTSNPQQNIDPQGLVSWTTETPLPPFAANKLDAPPMPSLLSGSTTWGKEWRQKAWTEFGTAEIGNYGMTLEGTFDFVLSTESTITIGGDTFGYSSSSNSSTGTGRNFRRQGVANRSWQARQACAKADVYDVGQMWGKVNGSWVKFGGLIDGGVAPWNAGKYYQVRSVIYKYTDE